MRISELSKQSGLSIPTIKYYLREGLLQPGTRTAPNQADYGDEHLHRLHLIKALADVGELPIPTIRDVLSAIDDPALPLHDVLGAAQRALGPQPDDGSSRELIAARGEVDGLLDDLGWRVSADAPGRGELARALVALRELGWKVDSTVFEHYARAADRLAVWELERTSAGTGRDRTVEAVVVGTVVFEAVLVALRRLAHERHSAVRFG